MHESDESWEKMIESVKKEIVDETYHFGEKKEGTGEIIYQALVSEIYDHLGLLVRNMKASQERLRKLATRTAHMFVNRIFFTNL